MLYNNFCFRNQQFVELHNIPVLGLRYKSILKLVSKTTISCATILLFFFVYTVLKIHISFRSGSFKAFPPTSIKMVIKKTNSCHTCACMLVFQFNTDEVSLHNSDTLHRSDLSRIHDNDNIYKIIDFTIFDHMITPLHNPVKLRKIAIYFYQMKLFYI